MSVILRIFHSNSGLKSDAGLKSDVTIVFLDPDFFSEAYISAIRVHLMKMKNGLLRIAAQCWIVHETLKH